MEMNLPVFLAVLFQVAGFVEFCRLGARLSDWLQGRSRWLPLAVGAVFILGAGVMAFVLAAPLGFVSQTVILFCLAFGGGMVARQHPSAHRG